jgi:hypothetical protein
MINSLCPGTTSVPLQRSCGELLLSAAFDVLVECCRSVTYTDGVASLGPAVTPECWPVRFLPHTGIPAIKI